MIDHPEIKKGDLITALDSYSGREETMIVLKVYESIDSGSKYADCRCLNGHESVIWLYEIEKILARS